MDFNNDQQDGLQNSDNQQNANEQNSYQPSEYQQNVYQQNNYQQNGYQPNNYQQNGYQQYGYQPNGNPQFPHRHPKKGFCVASLVLGIVSIVFFCFFYICIPCAILSLIFGIIANNAEKNGMAKAGIVMSIIGLALCILIYALIIAGTFEGYSQFSEFSGYNSY